MSPTVYSIDSSLVIISNINSDINISFSRKLFSFSDFLSKVMPLSHVWWCQRDYLSIVSWTVWLKQLMRKIIFKFLYLVVWSVNASLEKISQQPLSSVSSLNMLKAEKKHKNFSINQKKLLHQFCMENQNSKLKKNSQKSKRRKTKWLKNHTSLARLKGAKGCKHILNNNFYC